MAPSLATRAQETISNIVPIVPKALKDDSDEQLSKNQQRKKDKEEQKREKASARDAAAEEIERIREEEDAQAEQQETPEERARYGDISRAPESIVSANRLFIKDLSASDIGKTVTLRARTHHMRHKSANLAFCLFRQQGVSVQGILETQNGLTEHMIRWTRRILVESIVLVSGEVQAPPAPVVGASIHDIELKVASIHLIAAATMPVPFDIYHAELVPREAVDAADQDVGGDEILTPSSTDGGASPISPAAHIDNKERRKEHHEHLSKIGVDMKEHEEYHRALKIPTISDRTRLANRVVDLRTSVAQSIFRIQAGVCNLFRSYLDERGFIEMHTPKLQGGATESGASVFTVSYFGRPAFLAQSPQLAKQLCMSADFERIYEIGAVFRAENSNTARHLTEYTGLDIEMTFEHDYHEVMHLIDGLIKNMLKGIHEKYANELSMVRSHFPCEKFVWLEETPVIPFRDGIKMLKESGWTDCSEDEDLSTPAEKRLGALVREKYGTDYYILDKFPLVARPFYTMPDKDEPKFSNSFDIFLRGQEILSGGQRIHDAAMLEQSMMSKGVRPEVLNEYLDGFRWGAPPHAGCGFGLERIVFLLLNLGNIRHASLFPRDPKSLPAMPELGDPLRHTEANTLEPSWSRHRAEGTEEEMPELEKLIANYGDAPNTAWLDRRYEIWRHTETGAAVGFSRVNRYVIIMGDPLCDHSQLSKVVPAFLRYATKELKLKPIWLLASEDLERVLGEKHGWRTLTCVAEARVETSSTAATDPSGNVAKKVRHAEKEGVEIQDMPFGQLPTEEVRAEVDARVQDWLAARKGKQVHLTDVDPWRDPEHRRYFIGRERSGRVCALVVLAQLAPRHGYQIKWALDFPEAPGGTIEFMVINAIKEAQEMGAKRVTFGATPAPAFEAAHNIPGVKAKALAHTYAAITKSLRLLNKSEFKEKLGAFQDAEYICYPPRGLGPMAVRAILKFFGATEEQQEQGSSGVRTSEDSTNPSSWFWSPRPSVDGAMSPDSSNTPRDSMDISRQTSTHAASDADAVNGAQEAHPRATARSRDTSVKRSFFRKSVDLVRGRSAARQDSEANANGHIKIPKARSPLRD
ncbi:aspartyl-tRNA synthetase [Auriculariales sp. MPI-PUGE-AT-0066]|nr:aspartyl-tRNA synthetase [Auriculariales sp. MPI-PUGE-AT-0066]